MVGGSFVEDHRDDPADATRGAYTLVNAGISWRDFGSQANFLRFTGQNSTYYELSSHLVFARKTQFGVVSPYGSLYSINVPAGSGAARASGLHGFRFPCRNASLWAAASPCADFPSIRPARATPIPATPSGATRFSSTRSNCDHPSRTGGWAWCFSKTREMYTPPFGSMRLLKFTQTSPAGFRLHFQCRRGRASL